MLDINNERGCCAKITYINARWDYYFFRQKKIINDNESLV